jgi:hypothetical protein
MILPPLTRNPSPQLDTAQAYEFVQALFQEPTEGFLGISAFSNGCQTSWVDFARPDPTKQLAKILRNNRHKQTYFETGLKNSKPPKGRGKRKSASTVSALRVEVDCASGDHAAKNLPTKQEALSWLRLECAISPSIVLDSGGGFHVYWLLDDVYKITDESSRAKIESFLKGWEQKIAADFKGHKWHLDPTADLPRVLRLPGTFNHKYDLRTPEQRKARLHKIPHTVDYEYFDDEPWFFPDARYNLSEFNEYKAKSEEEFIPGPSALPSESFSAENADDLEGLVKLVANYCPPPGQAHMSFRLPLIGMLLREGVSREDVIAITLYGAGQSYITRDGLESARDHAIANIDPAIKKLAKGEKVKGFTQLGVKKGETGAHAELRLKGAHEIRRAVRKIYRAPIKALRKKALEQSQAGVSLEAKEWLSEVYGPDSTGFKSEPRPDLSRLARCLKHGETSHAIHTVSLDIEHSETPYLCEVKYCANCRMNAVDRNQKNLERWREVQVFKVTGIKDHDESVKLQSALMRKTLKVRNSLKTTGDEGEKDKEAYGMVKIANPGELVLFVNGPKELLDICADVLGVEPKPLPHSEVKETVLAEILKSPAYFASLIESYKEELLNNDRWVSAKSSTGKLKRTRQIGRYGDLLPFAVKRGKPSGEQIDKPNIVKLKAFKLMEGKNRLLSLTTKSMTETNKDRIAAGLKERIWNGHNLARLWADPKSNKFFKGPLRTVMERIIAYHDGINASITDKANGWWEYELSRFDKDRAFEILLDLEHEFEHPVPIPIAA